jgi:hypothetical protein
MLGLLPWFWVFFVLISVAQRTADTTPKNATTKKTQHVKNNKQKHSSKHTQYQKLQKTD